MKRTLRWFFYAAAALAAVLGLSLLGPFVARGLIGEAIPPAEQAPEGRFEEVRPFVAAGTVRVESRQGRIAVEAWDRPEIRLEAQFEVPRYTRFAFEVDAETGEARVFVERLERGLFGVARDGETGGGDSVTELVLRVPAASRVEVVSAAAEIAVDGVEGEVEVDTVVGSVEIAGSPRSVVVETVVSRLHFVGSAGSVTARSVHGPVTIEGTPGAVDVETVSGGVELVLPVDHVASWELRTHGSIETDRAPEPQQVDDEWVVESDGGEDAATVRVVCAVAEIRLRAPGR